MKVFRIDKAYIDQDYIKNIKKDEILKTKSGFLRIPATLTKAGIFLYRDLKGNIIRELRSPGEVFKPESLNTIKGIPFTNDHPADMVDPSNWQNLSHGSVGDKIKKRDNFIDAFITVYSKEMIDLILTGNKIELSCGYWAQSVDESGEFEGKKYDSIQKDIIYNHVSLVDFGRAGPNVKLHLDSKEIIALKEYIDTENILINNDIDYKQEKKFIMLINGKDVKLDAAGEVILENYIKSNDAKFEKLEKDLKTRIEKVETLQAKLDEAEEKIKNFDAVDHVGQARLRLEFENKVSPILGKDFKFDGVKDIEIKKAVLNKIKPDFDFTGKNDAYIDARFDIALENYKYDTADQNFAKAQEVAAEAMQTGVKTDAQKTVKNIFDKLEK